MWDRACGVRAQGHSAAPATFTSQRGACECAGGAGRAPGEVQVGWGTRFDQRTHMANLGERGEPATPRVRLSHFPKMGARGFHVLDTKFLQQTAPHKRKACRLAMAAC